MSVVKVVTVALLMFLLYLQSTPCCVFFFQIPVEDDKDADVVVATAVAMGCRTGRKKVGLCLVSMMAIQSLYCRNHFLLIFVVVTRNRYIISCSLPLFMLTSRRRYRFWLVLLMMVTMLLLLKYKRCAAAVSTLPRIHLHIFVGHRIICRYC